MTTLSSKISKFVAAHKKFPAAVDLRKADHRIWEELTPRETEYMLWRVSHIEYLGSEWDTGFQYWLYWLQAKRLRITNGNLAVLLTRKYKVLSMGITISRLKTGRRMPKAVEIDALYKLYLLSPSEIKQLKQEVLNSNGTTTK